MSTSDRGANHVLKHRRLKWSWVGVLVFGLVDYGIRDDISKLWTEPMADSVPWLFIFSVSALALSNWAAEEAAEGKEKDPR